MLLSYSQNFSSSFRRLGIPVDLENTLVEEPLLVHNNFPNNIYIFTKRLMRVSQCEFLGERRSLHFEQLNIFCQAKAASIRNKVQTVDGSEYQGRISRSLNELMVYSYARPHRIRANREMKQVSTRILLEGFVPRIPENRFERAF